MKFTIISLLLACFSFISDNSFSQLRTLEGKVTVMDSIPVLNQTIKVRSTKEVVKTDSLGRFAVQCEPRDKIILKGKVIYTERINVDEDVDFIDINIELQKPDRAKYIDLIYGRVLEADNANAISTMRSDEEDFSMYTDMLDLLQGRFSGVDVYGGNIQIRGASSVSSSGNPLIMVDGVKVSYSYFKTIHPMDVKSINILKDASASMYGIEGGNGVIVVKTKTGGSF